MCVCVCVYIYIYTCTIYICIYIHTHIYIYTHIHIIYQDVGQGRPLQTRRSRNHSRADSIVARCRNALKGPRDLCLSAAWPISLPCPQPVGRRGRRRRACVRVWRRRRRPLLPRGSLAWRAQACRALRRASLEEPEEVVEEEGVLSLSLCLSLLPVREEIEEKLQSCRRPNRHRQAHLLVPAGGGGRQSIIFLFLV
jgi:hypothetical protein